MKTISLDILEKSDLPTSQAHAILKVMELEMTSGQESLATKVDIAKLREETKVDIANLREETKVDIANLRADMLDRFGRIEGRFGEMDGRFGALEGKLARWVLTCVMGQTAVLAGLGYFFLAHFGR